MEIGIVLNRVKFEEKQLIKAAQAANLKIHQFNNQRLKLTLSSEKDIQPNISVFIQRSLSLTRGLYTTAILEAKGYNVINNYKCISESGDKLISSLRLAQSSIPTPKTSIAFTPKTAIELAEEQFTFPVISKPIIGSWGRMVAKLNDIEALQALLEARDVMGNPFQKIHYIQEYIDSRLTRETAPTDIRAFYLNGEVIAAIGRYRSSKDFRSNFTLGGEARPYPISDEMQKLCKKIAETFDGDILGIDLMETDNGYTCLEVNGTPGFEGVSRTCNINIGERIIDFIKSKYS